MKVAALIVAAGAATRFGAPKQYAVLAGAPLLRHSVAAFLRHRAVDAVRVVIAADERGRYDGAMAGLELMTPVTGGPSRQDSVRLGLESLQDDPPSQVLIHDAARPYPSAGLIARVAAALDQTAGAIPALAVTDTLKSGDGRRVAATVDRTGLFRAQTPQGFHYQAILAAHRDAAGRALTDDAAIAEAAGLEVAMVEGEESNLKITGPDDLVRAEVLAGGETRVGTGFDLHRFGPGDHVMLCGVAIAHGRGLAGHSDADVALHALTDALLGAAGEGDIGAHFPPLDPRWKDAASAEFVTHALSRIAARGGSVVHVDLTIICEDPKIGPHRAAMTERVAEMLELESSRVSIKATTTEGVGVTGRGEGIAAQAVATIRLPAGA